ncbi:hypothetical protein R1sor_023703 [Riccia sorocarpa]|uniref:Uncharacterized protein n=1 Tax=Riccia sorocarpa TaxID=122646 RepID=A0ABD3GNF0_9MARC
MMMGIMRNAASALFFFTLILSLNEDIKGCHCEMEVLFKRGPTMNIEGREDANVGHPVIPSNCMFPLCCCEHGLPPSPGDGRCQLEKRCCCWDR